MSEDHRSSKSRRRLVWFGLLTLIFLVVVGLLAAMIGVPWMRYRNQQQIIARIEALGGEAYAEQRGAGWHT